MIAILTCLLDKRRIHFEVCNCLAALRGVLVKGAVAVELWWKAIAPATTASGFNIRVLGTKRTVVGGVLWPF